MADKRDILVGILRDSKKLPEFDILNQGSYSMYIGTEPLDGKEYDIDVGLRFNVNKSDYEPMELKNIIQEILANHTDYGATIKKPCVTVTYKKMVRQRIMLIWFVMHMKLKTIMIVRCI